jgi:hypothetical protein
MSCCGFSSLAVVVLGGKLRGGWLILELKEVVRYLDLRSLEDVEMLLKTFLYRESTFHRSLCEIWEEINS